MAVVVASNILVQFPANGSPGRAYLPDRLFVTDVMNRVYLAAARKGCSRVVVGVICSLIGSRIMLEGEAYHPAWRGLRPARGSPSPRNCSTSRFSTLRNAAGTAAARLSWWVCCRHCPVLHHRLRLAHVFRP